MESLIVNQPKSFIEDEVIWLKQRNKYHFPNWSNSLYKNKGITKKEKNTITTIPNEIHIILLSSTTLQTNKLFFISKFIPQKNVFLNCEDLYVPESFSAFFGDVISEQDIQDAINQLEQEKQKETEKKVKDNQTDSSNTSDEENEENEGILKFSKLWRHRLLLVDDYSTMSGNCNKRLK
ncbi:hypothetical protein GLOIN_2v1496980 [Rhizophagus irregularis DAOM 181602=DAOM 197198]|nr:hypothetical protein GLOIN_2v1496980 [Rhizophagus irregularis DAOM 181602=DAOM 197198]